MLILFLLIEFTMSISTNRILSYKYLLLFNQLNWRFREIQRIHSMLLKFSYLELKFNIVIVIRRHIMGTWTKQMGFPVVTVRKDSDTEYVLTQQRFFSNPDNANETTSESEYK